MRIELTDAPRIADVLERSDYWRRSPASAGGRSGHKEWSYFCVLADGFDLVVNLSITDRPPLSHVDAGAAECARVVLLARTAGGGWVGDVDDVPASAVRVTGGRIDASLGRNTLTFADGAYHLALGLSTQPVEGRLVLRPTARPALTRSVPLGRHEPMHWVVVPRLEATGEVRVGGAVHALQACPTYHDHNWGQFAWGGDFAWEWGVILGDGRGVPWTLIVYRITDRGRHHVTAQGVLVWRRDRHCRTFRDAQVDVRTVGFLRSAGCLRVPRVMSLAVPGAASDIPARMEVEARAGDDAIDVSLDLHDCAQVAVPDDVGDGVTSIFECHGRTHVSGRVCGEAVHFDAPAIVEFNRAA